MTTTRGYTSQRAGRRVEPQKSRQEYDIASLAEGVRAVLIGRGWECLGRWEWAVSRARGAHRQAAPACTSAGARQRRGSHALPGSSLATAAPQASALPSGRPNAPVGGLDQTRKFRRYLDLSRPTPARIPGHDAPTHWSPVAPIDLEALGDVAIARRYVNIRARPSPAHEVLPEDQGGTGDAAWPYAYAPAGCISRPEAEHRVLRAIKTARTPGVVREIRVGFRSNWPVAQMVAGWGDYAPPITVRAFNPTRRDLDDWWVALGWFARLYPVPARGPDWQPGDWNAVQRIVAWRAADPPYSWRQIGDQLGRSNEWSRRTYTAAIDRVWQMANGGM